MTTVSPSRSQHWFATTQWSVVMSAARDNNTASRMALEALCERYWQPLYSYVRRRGYSADNAQDLTQEFFVRILDQNRLARADQQRGRFRMFLLGALKNFLADEWDRARALKRGGGVPVLSLEFQSGEALYVMEPVNNVTPEQVYERRWALTLLENVLGKLREEHADEGKGELFEALSPCLVGQRTSQPYAELAGRLGMTETAIKSAVHRLRRRYRELLRREISHTVATETEVDEELGFLFEVLSRPV